MSPVCFGTVLDSVLSHQTPRFTDKGVALEERLDSSVRGAGVIGDPYLLELAFNKVLQNALEASNRGGRVVLEAAAACTDDNGVVRVRVSDSGAGISEDKLQQVLVPFYTSKNDHEGLGLSMASRFIEMHGGRLVVTSAESKGTTVDIAVPAVAAASK
jgi:signal transduction histidine kinase